MFPMLTVNFRQQLDALGITQGDIFFALGIDDNVTNCELLLSPVFKTLEQARDAALNMGRPKWLVAHWALDLASGFEVAETNP
jgi:hypothetical protein